MKTVSIRELKARISALLAEAAAGTRLLITKRGRPVAMLAAPEHQAIHVGERFGRGKLAPLLREATAGRYLDVLADDRHDEH
jgi:antitoxin (DNA-binding transcriptional repressor) of toxin-antitoxin stability system